MPMLDLHLRDVRDLGAFLRGCAHRSPGPTQYAAGCSLLIEDTHITWALTQADK